MTYFHGRGERPEVPYAFRQAVAEYDARRAENPSLPRAKAVFGRQSQTVWAQGTNPFGRSSDNRVFFIGRVIYSHGTHYALAYLLPDGRAIVNEKRYSISTTQHRADVVSAVGYQRYFECPELTAIIDSIDYLCDPKGSDAFGRSSDNPATLKYHRKRIMMHVEKHALTMTTDCASELLAVIKSRSNFESIRSRMMLKSKREIAAYEATTRKHELAKAREFIKLETDPAEHSHYARRRDQMRKESERRDDWLAGLPIHGFYQNNPTLLRIRGERLETSQGAEVPLEHAKKVWPMIRLCKESGRNWQANGHTIAVGHFQVSRITADGTLTAGCHTIRWPEIDRIATELWSVPPAINPGDYGESYATGAGV